MGALAELFRHLLSNDHGEWQALIVVTSDWWFCARIQVGVWGHRVARLIL